MLRRRVTRVLNLRRDFIPEDAVYIGRGKHGAYMGLVSPGVRGWLGNPYTSKKHGSGAYVGSPRESIRCFKAAFLNRVEDDPIFRRAVLETKGKDLVCFCPPNPCHGEVVLEWLENNFK